MKRSERTRDVCESWTIFRFSFSCTGTFEPTKTSFIARKQWIRKIDNRTEKNLPKFFSLKDAEKEVDECEKLFVTYVLSRRYFKCFVFKSVLTRSVETSNRKVKGKSDWKKIFLPFQHPPANLWVWKISPPLYNSSPLVLRSRNKNSDTLLYANARHLPI